MFAVVLAAWGSLIQDRHWAGASPVQATKLVRGLEIMAYGERLTSGLVQPWEGGQRWNLRAVFSYLMGGYGGDRTRNFLWICSNRTRGNRLKLQRRKIQLDIKRCLAWDFFITKRVVKTLERGPTEVVHSLLMEILKLALTRLWMTWSHWPFEWGAGLGDLQMLYSVILCISANPTLALHTLTVRYTVFP